MGLLFLSNFHCNWKGFCGSFQILLSSCIRNPSPPLKILMALVCNLCKSMACTLIHLPSELCRGLASLWHSCVQSIPMRIAWKMPCWFCSLFNIVVYLWEILKRATVLLCLVEGACFESRKISGKCSLQGTEPAYFSWQLWRKPALLSFKSVWVDTNKKM